MAMFLVEYFEENDVFYSLFEHQTVEGSSREELIQKIHAYFKDKYGSESIVNISKGVSKNG